jgi:hypothetical protein
VIAEPLLIGRHKVDRSRCIDVGAEKNFVGAMLRGGSLRGEFDDLLRLLPLAVFVKIRNAAAEFSIAPTVDVWTTR